MSSLSSAVITYTTGVLMVLYAGYFRGFIVHDWSDATIMMFIGVMGMCLQYAMSTQHDSSK